MRVRCPHCQSQVEVDNADQQTEMDCRVCGSTFRAEADETVIYRAPSERQWITHFELVSPTGSGAAGVVWEARDTQLDRTVAIKIARRDRLSSGDMELFLREAQAAAQLKHPNIVSVHEAGRDGDTIYIVSDFVHGVTLSQWLRDSEPTPRAAAELCAKLADALHHAHEAGVVHRDIKPSNIMVDAEGEPHVMDFGLAKREANDLTISTDGYIMGTPAYMSPEQARGESQHADRRSDVYSLGVTLFHVLTGEKPFRGTDQAMLQQVISTDAPSPRRLNVNIPRDLDTICMKCLEKAPQQRYATASELAEELRRHLSGEPIHARPITRVDRAWRWCRRNPLTSGLVTALTLSLLVGLIGITTQWIRADRHAASAEISAQDARLAANRERQAHQETGQYLYVAHMNLAQQAYELTDPQRVVDILNTHRPNDETDEDRRSFEWHYWWRQAHRWSKDLQTADPVNAVAISEDGRTLASAGENGSIALWDVVSGEQRATLTGHEAPVFCLAFSPGRNLLASAGQDSTLRIWDVSTESEEARLDIGTSLFSLAFSRDGNSLVGGGADLAVRLWNVNEIVEAEEPAPRLVLVGDPHDGESGHFDFVYTVAISHDGQTLASAGLDRTICIWDANTGQHERTLTGHDLEVWTVAFSPDGETLASGSADQTVRLWDPDTGDNLVTLDGHTDRVRAVVFSPDGRTLASAGHDRTINLWDMTAESRPLDVPYRNLNRPGDHFFERMELPNSAFLQDSLVGHARPLTSLAWSSNGRTLASGSLDASVKLWNVSELEDMSILFDHEKTTNSIAISHNGQTMISGSNDRTARVWDVTTMQPVGEPWQHDDMVLAVALSPDGKAFATGSFDGLVRLGTLSGSDPTILEGHQRAASAVAFSPDSALLASGSHDGTVQLWDVETAQHRLTYTGHEERVQAVVFLAEGNLVASAGADGTIQIWSVDTGDLVRTLQGHDGLIWSLALSPDGTRLASASADKTVKLWDVNQEEPLRTFVGHAETVRCVTFCPDGNTLASGGDDKTIMLWDIATGEPKTTLKGHRFRVWTVAFTPDGQTLVSGSLAIRIWHGDD